MTKARVGTGSAGVIALRVPPPPQYAPPAICSISKDGRIVATGGKDVETLLWDTQVRPLQCHTAMRPSMSPIQRHVDHEVQWPGDGIMLGLTTWNFLNGL